MAPHGSKQDSAGKSAHTHARRPLVVLAGKDIGERQAMRVILETWDLDVTEAGSCSEAPEVAGSVLPDLVLLDAEIPFTESLEAAATLRNQQPTADTPVLMLSEFTQSPFREAALAQGVADYITKPFGLEHLHNIVLNLIRPPCGPYRPLRKYHNRPRVRPNSVL